MKKSIYIFFFFTFTSSLSSEIIVFKDCTIDDYEFEKNEYKIDIDKGIMIRDFIYTDETYKRLKMNDIRVKKENSSTKMVTRKNGEIVTVISGYPAFYTQMIFDTFDKTIKLRSFLNNSEGISILSNCEKILKYKLKT